MKEIAAFVYGFAVDAALATLAALCVALAGRWVRWELREVVSTVLVDVHHRNLNRMLFVVAIVGACLYGGAKNDSGRSLQETFGSSASRSQTRTEGGTDARDEGVLSFTSFSVSSNKAYFALSWRTNFSPARAWIELYEKLHSLTNPWLLRLVREMPSDATNDAFSVSFTNGAPSAAFYSARVDALHVDFPGLEMTEDADGRRVYTSFGSRSFPVSVDRSQRPDGYPPQDPAFAANPFVYTEGLSYDADTSTLTTAEYGTYELPDGSVLAAFANPKASFGVPHDYVGTTLSYDAGSYAKASPYPLTTPALQKGWSRGNVPDTGCSCVPTVDFGGGIVVRDTSRSSLLRNGAGLPDGMWTDYEYAPGGVWITLYNYTNVLWRTWCAHHKYADNGGTSDELGGPQEEDPCGCGDVDSLEGSSSGSVRFRIPLGSACEGEVSGFLYFNRDTPFDVTPSAFELLCRDDAFVTDAYDSDGTRTVVCRALRGRTLVVRENDEGDGVDIEVRDTASDDLQHTWTVTRNGQVIRIVQVSILNNTMQDKSYAYESGEWIETDNISGLSERRIVQNSLNIDGTLHEERIVTCAGKVAVDVVTTSQRFGTGTNAVLRETERRELGADATWKVAHASYWVDVQHPRRHGSLRLEYGDDRAWSYRAYDDSGRVVFRLDQRDGSPVPADSLDYSISNLPSAAAAFATAYDYAPLPGDAGHSNDWDKVRVETKYTVENGIVVLIGRTWKTYGRGMSDGYPTIVVTTERAGSQTAQKGDAGNAVSVSAVFDDESADVPYVLRGEPAEESDEDGVTTRYERTDVRGVLRTVERKFFNGNEFKTRRVTERDWNYGNLLYEATAVTADGTEFDWRRHAYDEKNRLRSTHYADGSGETNAYSCCRLLWTVDRTGAKRLRSAQTGTDRLFYANVDEYVRALPKDAEYYDDVWFRHRVFIRCVPLVQHCFDGLGRETNVVVRSGYYADGNTEPSLTSHGYVHPSVTDYPDGVTDCSVSADARGLRTVRRVHETGPSRIETREEFCPGESGPAVAVTNVTVRGGGSTETRWTQGRAQTTARWKDYLDDGTMVEHETTADLGGVCVTNRVKAYDFLGRVIREDQPGVLRHYAYSGTSSRVVNVRDEISGVETEPVYDSDGTVVGQFSSGVEDVSLTDYVLSSGAWWKVETSFRCSGGVTNDSSAVWLRQTGLDNDRRSERIEFSNGVEVRRTVTSYDVASQTETETVDDATAGRSWTRRKFGLPVETGSPLGGIVSFYGPTGKVFSRYRTAPPSDPYLRKQEFVCVNGLGDVVSRLEADGSWGDDLPYSAYGYDCRGNLAAVTNELGDVVNRSYDADGNLTEESGDAYPVRWHYDVRGNLSGLDTMRTGPGWDATHWSYDSATGACQGKTYADESLVSYTQTPDGLPLRTTQPDGRWTENLYDANRWLVGQTSSDASCAVQYANDAFGRPVSAASPSATYAWELSSDGVATNELATVGDETCEIVRRLDAYGRAVSLSADDSAKTSVFYAPNGLIACISNDDCVVRYDYDALGNDMGHVLSLSNGTTFVRTLTRHAYLRDEILSVVNVCGEATNAYAYTYDVLHRPVSRNADTFAYNRRGEVTNEVVSGVARPHSYDFIGNEQPANCLNQYLGLGYSANGELTSDGEYAYAYDALSRLTAVCRDGALVVSNRYDHLGRRVVKVAADGTHTFFYDGWRPVRETVAKTDGTTNRIEYVWGKDISGTLDGAAGIGGLLYVKIDGAIYVPFYDAYGNVMEYRDADGAVVAAYVYDAFGKTVSQTGSLADVFRFRHATKSYEVESGLYYYGYRFYSPLMRRWIARDPSGVNGGLNLYSAMDNALVCNYDALGLQATFKPDYAPQDNDCIMSGGRNPYPRAVTRRKGSLHFTCDSQCRIVVSGSLSLSIELLPQNNRRWRVSYKQYKNTAIVSERLNAYNHELDHFYTWSAFYRFLVTANSFDGKKYSNCKQKVEDLTAKYRSFESETEFHSARFDDAGKNMGGQYSRYPLNVSGFSWE